MNKAIKTLLLLLLLFMVVLAPNVAAQDNEDEEDEDIEVFGVELEELLNFFSGLLALVLCGLTWGAYRRNRNPRLLYVSSAFLLFGVKGLLMSSELVFGEWAFVDPVSSAMDFVILITFFIGIIKK